MGGHGVSPKTWAGIAAEGRKLGRILANHSILMYSGFHMAWMVEDDSSLDSCSSHRHEDVYLISQVGCVTAGVSLLQNDTDQILRRIHPHIGSEHSGFFVRTDRGIAIHPKWRCDDFVSEALANAGRIAGLQVAGLRGSHCFDSRG